MKPGWQTSEFWLSLAPQLIGAVLASGAVAGSDTVTRLLGLAASVLSALGYTAARTWLKASDTAARAASLVVPVLEHPPG